MLSNKIESNNFNKIAPTAWGVARHRTFADIKYAQEIFEELDKVVKPQDDAQAAYMESVRKSKIAPQIEARYKLIDKLIIENKTSQILELAAGLAGRGMTMTQNDPSLQYVEVDLPEMAESKRLLLRSLISKNILEPQRGLHIEDGNALDLDSLLEATRHFKDKSVTIVNEGLLRYLNFDEKRQVADNVRALLNRFGGTWITSDITLKRTLQGENNAERGDNRQKILLLSGIDVNVNSFDDEDKAKNFFEGLGFSIERHSFMEVVDELASPAKLCLSRDEVRDLLKDPVVFVMRLA